MNLRKTFTDLLNWLNGVGSVVLAYALLNPSAASDFLSVLPDRLKTPAALMLPTAWFLLVQYGKMRAIRKGEANG